MHCSSPKMVCETKIVAEDHESISGSKKDTIIVSSSQMWPSLSGSPSSSPASRSGVEEDFKKNSVYIREFHPSEQEVARRIFYEGIMERIPNTAFRGLKHQPLTQLVYGILIVICFVVTKSLLLTCCLPIFLMGMRYYFSRKVILSYLEYALHTDMSDIEQYYMKPPAFTEQQGREEDLESGCEHFTGIWEPFTHASHQVCLCSCFWVAVLDGNVVGIVAARGNEEDNTMELRRMSVDANFRGKGIAKALGRKVLEFAMLNNYSSIVLGTTAVKMAAHKLYESLGFKHAGVIEHYTLPGMTHSILERMFFQLRYHRYCLQLREE
ncbi:N-acetylaspartate synthetase isoform X1 [Carettochelys insculpta]|uniref:N-acetylaspartate synthetase isoform X1 n=1 Tax=Carettochelys insculpta TaxID=44489 RepID=UPI003EBBD8DA